MKDLLKRLVANEDGATMVEYALMVALIAAVAVAAVTSLGSTINSKFGGINTSIGGGS